MPAEVGGAALHTGIERGDASLAEALIASPRQVRVGPGRSGQGLALFRSEDLSLNAHAFKPISLWTVGRTRRRQLVSWRLLVVSGASSGRVVFDPGLVLRDPRAEAPKDREPVALRRCFRILRRGLEPWVREPGRFA